MIQRPQTVYLLLVSLINLAVFFTPIYSRAMDDPYSWIGMGLAISLTLAMMIAFGSIFLFKNRQLQLNIVKLATYIQIVAIASAAGVLFSLGGLGVWLWREAIGAFLILISLFFLWMAGRGIKKDEDLVKSMDRIR